MNQILSKVTYLLIAAALLTFLLANRVAAFRTAQSENTPASAETPLVTATAEETNEPAREPARSQVVSALAIQKYASEGPIWTQEKKQISMSAANLRYQKESQQISVDLCFSLPAPDEWYVGIATLQAGDVRLLLSSVEFHELVKSLDSQNKSVMTYDGLSVIEVWLPYDGVANYACQSLYFFSPDATVNLETLDLTQAQLTIESLQVLAKEGEDACAFADRIVQPALKTTSSGIELGCVYEKEGARFVIKNAEDGFDISPSRFAIQGQWVFP